MMSLYHCETRLEREWFLVLLANTLLRKRIHDVIGEKQEMPTDLNRTELQKSFYNKSKGFKFVSFLLRTPVLSGQ